MGEYNPMVSKQLALIAAACVLVAPMQSAAVQITAADFVDPVVTTYDGLGLSTFPLTPLIINGATYTGPTGNLLYGNFGTCLSGECIGRDNVGDSPGSQWVDIVLDEPMTAVGAWFNTIFDTFVVLVEFFDDSDSILASLTVGTGFTAWGDTEAIRRIRVTDIVNDGRIFLIDDFYSRNVYSRAVNRGPRGNGPPWTWLAPPPNTYQAPRR
jgi:hypothetical protein